MKRGTGSLYIGTGIERLKGMRIGLRILSFLGKYRRVWLLGIYAITSGVLVRFTYGLGHIQIMRGIQ